MELYGWYSVSLLSTKSLGQNNLGTTPRTFSHVVRAVNVPKPVDLV